MKAIKYEIRVTMSALDAARGWETSVQEVWVARPNGKSFCFNDKFGMFFCEEPRSTENTVEVEIDSEAVQRAVDLLDARDRLLAVFGKEEVSG